MPLAHIPDAGKKVKTAAVLYKKHGLLQKPAPKLTYRQKIERDIKDHGRGEARWCCLERPWEEHCGAHKWHMKPME